MRIYVATSWKNELQPMVVEYLRLLEHEVYDFRNPKEGDEGFHWKQVSERPLEEWTHDYWKQVLQHPRAEEGFQNDMSALHWCDACLLVMPCGRSAHMELGWAAASGRHTAVMVPPGHPVEPDLMVKMTSGGLLFGMEEVRQWLKSIEGL